MTNHRLMLLLSQMCLVGVVILVLTAPRALAVPGMVGWWQAENNANDSVGGNNGTLQGGVQYGPGVSGKGFQLDGVNGYVSIPHSDSLNFGTADFTVGFWVNFNDPHREGS
jgi:hypothetical protein